MATDGFDIDAMAAQLTSEEAVRPFVYDDATGTPIKPGSVVHGHPTIGVGRCLDLHGLSSDEIHLLLTNDIALCVDTLKHFAWFTELDSIRQRAIVDICFNVGLANLLQFHVMISALANHDYRRAAIAAQQSIWFKQVGKRASHIVNMIETGLP